MSIGPLDIQPGNTERRYRGRLGWFRLLAGSDPALLKDYAGMYWRYRMPNHQRPQARATATALSHEGALNYIGQWMDISAPGPALTLARSARIPGEANATGLRAEAANFAADSSMGEIVYHVIRGMAIRLVIETGVAAGLTSAYALAALEDNASGVLHSIDLPPRNMTTEGFVGSLVPGPLRSRWRYHWGTARRWLPKLLANARGQLGLFVHDSDHSYDNMRWEFESAWPALVPGGWLVVDDADCNSALLDFADSVSCEPFISAQTMKSGYTGLLRKPN